ncbi:MAG: aminotransferase class I/II-fold pyridoxal phosphate-dependent enzyme [Nanoarchaeota archaeon]|nr:aminotransferase class I/II-fold pyridoxal phosphate-dependent enzyme [Nanoarchaeota archaeon]
MKKQKQKIIEREEKIKATKTVYCYYFPEIRKIIDRVVKNYPHKVFLSSINPGLDNFHLPAIEKFIEYHKKLVPGLKNFPFKYFTEGSRQGIFHFLVELKCKEPDIQIYTLNEEYEGYKEYAVRIGIKIKKVDENEDFSKLEPGIFFISNPSGRDGNIIPNEFVKNICKYHRVVYDLAYVGLTQEHVFDVGYPNIIAVMASMSKPFGMYYYRAGFAFTKEPLETLIGNKWFKNIFSLVVTEKVLDNIKPQELYKKYKPIQEKIVNSLNEKHNLSLKASDAILLANTTEAIEPFIRGKFCRLCLTPYFLEEEGK